MLVWRRIHWRDRKKCGKTLEWAYQPWCAFGASTPLPPPSKTPLSSFSPTPSLKSANYFLLLLLSKNFNPPWKMSPALCSNPLLKFGTFQAPQPFENLVVGSTPRLLLMNWVRLTILRNWRLKEWSYYYWIKETVETLLHCSNHE